MKKIIGLILILLLLAAGVFAVSIYGELRKTADDSPLVWEPEIAHFEKEDVENPPPTDAVLFVGSSSIRFWHSLEEDMAPLVTIRRGFGGARIKDVVHYAGRLINRYSPSTVVLFVGSNDINVSDTPMDVVPVIAEGLQRLVDIIHESNGKTEIYYLAITPTPFSWRKRDAVRAANSAAEAVMSKAARAHFIATSDLFLDASGKPDRNLFRLDGLHLSDAGYERWTGRIKPILIDNLAARASAEAI